MSTRAINVIHDHFLYKSWFPGQCIAAARTVGFFMFFSYCLCNNVFMAGQKEVTGAVLHCSRREMAETEGDDKNFNPKPTKRRKVVSGDDQDRRIYKRSRLLLIKPSYTLKQGSKSIQDEHRVKLRGLLYKLVRQQNWLEASGVLSVLLKGTCKERSLQNNRFKYWVAMELIRHVESDAAAYQKGIERLYGTWMGKLHSWKNKPLKDKNAKLESILSVLAHYTTRVPSVIPALVGQDVPRLTSNERTLSRRRSNAREDARSLLLTGESASDPLSNLVIGLTFYEDWYFTLPKELQLENVAVDRRMPMETVGYNSYEQVDDVKWDNSGSICETHPNLHHHSETSINSKGAHSASRGDTNMPVVDQQIRDHGLWQLLPVRCYSSEDMEDLFSFSRGPFDNTYKYALKHLSLAFRSGPPVSEAALLPLLQVLLLRDQTEEALIVLEDACNNSNSMLPFRLRAHVWEWFNADDLDKLSGYVEDVLKKDPACRYSLAKLISLHQKGGYARERLVEMIALHLEVTYPDHNTWSEFASCLLKLSRCEEVASMRVDGVSITRIPVMFKGKSRKTWKLRCKWWLNRHFSKEILATEMSAGNLRLIAYKAACASHLYGKEFEYVAKVKTCLEGHDDKTLLTFFHLHIKSPIGFYSKFLSI